MPDPRILFVDDDRDILAMVEQYLTIKGYDVTTVDNGIDAVGLVKEKNIDIVFTDYKMPEFNGLELLVAIKKYRPQTEVIIVTGYASMESAIQAMKFGSYDYLQKPFKLDHLRLIIDRIVEEKKIKNKIQLIRKIARERHQYGDLIGFCPKMREIYELIDTLSIENPMVLIQAHIANAAMLVVALPDSMKARQMAETARQLNPGIEIVLRTHGEEESALLRKEQLGTVFYGEEELARGMSRHVLQRFNAPLDHAGDGAAVPAAGH